MNLKQRLEASIKLHELEATHDFAWTGYCLKCGQSREHVVNNRVACFGQPKITPISHYRRDQILDAARHG
jgi:hypothetical protein